MGEVNAVYLLREVNSAKVAGSRNPWAYSDNTPSEAVDNEAGSYANPAIPAIRRGFFPYANFLIEALGGPWL